MYCGNSQEGKRTIIRINEGIKEMILVDDVENREFLRELLEELNIISISVDRRIMFEENSCPQ
jgi:hypothetical protein